MSFKYYRRRYKFQIAIGLVILIFLYVDLTKSKDSSDSTNVEKQKIINNENQDQLEKKVYKNVRVNMKNYVPPAPCNGCPGEDGKAVYLNVS